MSHWAGDIFYLVLHDLLLYGNAVLNSKYTLHCSLAHPFVRMKEFRVPKVTFDGITY